MDEVVPGIHHWTAVHPDINMRVSCHYVEPAGIVIDPLEPEDGFGFFDALDRPPKQVVLTNNLHWRHCERFRDRYGIPVRGVDAGLYRFEGTDREVEPYSFGEELAPGVTALEVGGICPDDAALHIEHGNGVMAFADGLIHYEGALYVMPGFLMDDPEETKEALRSSLRGLLDKEFDTLLVAHGTPMRSGGHAALSDFVSKPLTEVDLDQTG